MIDEGLSLKLQNFIQSLVRNRSNDMQVNEAIDNQLNSQVAKIYPAISPRPEYARWSSICRAGERS